MISEKDRKWAHDWDVSPENVQKFRDELIRADKLGEYHVYDTKIEEMDDDEVKVAYTKMRNYLSDFNTHH